MNEITNAKGRVILYIPRLFAYGRRSSDLVAVLSKYLSRGDLLVIPGLHALLLPLRRILET